MSRFKNGWVLPWGRVALFALPFFAVVAMVGCLDDGERAESVLRVEKLIARQNFAEAMSVLQKLDEGAFDAGEARNSRLQRAICSMNLGEYVAALAIFRALDGADQVLGDYVSFWMGRCAEALGQAEDAENHYAKILAMPTGEFARGGGNSARGSCRAGAGQCTGRSRVLSGTCPRGVTRGRRAGRIGRCAVRIGRFGRGTRGRVAGDRKRIPRTRPFPMCSRDSGICAGSKSGFTRA